MSGDGAGSGSPNRMILQVIVDDLWMPTGTQGNGTAVANDDFEISIHVRGRLGKPS